LLCYRAGLGRAFPNLGADATAGTALGDMARAADLVSPTGEQWACWAVVRTAIVGLGAVLDGYQMTETRGVVGSDAGGRALRTVHLAGHVFAGHGDLEQREQQEREHGRLLLVLSGPDCDGSGEQPRPPGLIPGRTCGRWDEGAQYPSWREASQWPVMARGATCRLLCNRRLSCGQTLPVPMRAMWT
jgi:hypothetical protein